MGKIILLCGTFASMSALLCTSCSSTQRITVKQEQEGQVQETVIESDTKIREISMIITHGQNVHTLRDQG